MAPRVVTTRDRDGRLFADRLVVATAVVVILMAVTFALLRVAG